MRMIQPEENGWTGLAYYYNIEKPWWEDPWEIPDKAMVLEQLQKIKTEHLNAEAKELLEELCDMLSSSLRLNESVWIADE